MSEKSTFTGNRGLELREDLIFEIGARDRSGVDLAPLRGLRDRLGGITRDAVDLPGLSEPEAMRHYVRLSQKNHAIDMGLYPLGSCTMKHNPRSMRKWRGCRALPIFTPCNPLNRAGCVTPDG